MENVVDILPIAIQLQNLIGVLVIAAMSVVATVDLLKPIILDPFGERVGEELRLPIILVLRFIVALAYMATAAQIQPIYEAAPILQSYNQAAVIVGLSLAIVFLSQFGYLAQKIVGVFIDGMQGRTPPPTPEPSV